jgi:hypothetical protein
MLRIHAPFEYVQVRIFSTQASMNAFGSSPSTT